MKPLLLIRALSELLIVDLITRRGFKALCTAVTTMKPSARVAPETVVKDVVESVEYATVFYFRHARCLQRSVAVTRMLRRRGFPATLVIGYRPMPIDSHAWVELNGVVVSDQTKHLEDYRVLDRW